MRVRCGIAQNSGETKREFTCTTAESISYFPTIYITVQIPAGVMQLLFPIPSNDVYETLDDSISQNDHLEGFFKILKYFLFILTAARSASGGVHDVR